MRRLNARIISQVRCNSRAGRRQGLAAVVLLVHGHDFGAVQHPRKIHFGQGPRDGPRPTSALSVGHGGGGELLSKVVRLGELRREGPLLPLLPLFLADDNLLAILRGRVPEIVVGLDEIRREEVEPVEPVEPGRGFSPRPTSAGSE